MKARLFKIGENYYLQTQEEMSRIARNSARHFLLNFSDAKYSDALNMEDTEQQNYDDEVIAELTDSNDLLVKNAESFRAIVENSGVTMVSVKQFAESHGKSASMTRRHCQNQKIEGAILTPGGYIIPEDAAYPR